MAKTLYREKLNSYAKSAHIEYFGEHLSIDEREKIDAGALDDVAGTTAKGSMRLGIPYTDTQDKTTWELLQLDQTVVARNGITTDTTVGHSITIGKEGFYEVDMGIQA